MRTSDFEEIYEIYSDRIYSYIFLFVRNRELAEDLTQETFLKAFQHFDRFQGTSSVYTWLIQIARNSTFDYFRRKKIIQFLPIKKEKVSLETPQEIVMKGEEIKRLYEIIMSLKMEYKEVLILRKIKEFSIRETAEILGWDEIKVKNTTARAMKALRSKYINEGGEINGRFTKN